VFVGRVSVQCVMYFDVVAVCRTMSAYIIHGVVKTVKCVVTVNIINSIVSVFSLLLI
jgi:hypothetical protein